MEVFDDDSAVSVDANEIARELSVDESLSRILADALTNGSHIRPQTLAQYRAAVASFERVLVDAHGPLRGMCPVTGVVRLALYSLSELSAAAIARMLGICLSSPTLKPDGQLTSLSSALNHFSVRQECESLNPFKTSAVKWKKAALSATMRKFSGGRTHAPGISSDGLRRVVSWLVSAHPGDAARAPGGMSHASLRASPRASARAASRTARWACGPSSSTARPNSTRAAAAATRRPRRRCAGRS